MQKFLPKNVHLKNGLSVVIRQAEVSDAENLLEAIKIYIPESQFIPKLESEIKLTVAQESEWIQSFMAHDNSLLLIAEYEGQIIGNIDLTASRRKIMEHTALVGMGIIEEFRNIGLGTVLLSEVINWAKQNPILELIWLQVYTENVLGLGLYKKVGFVENGIIKNFFKREDCYFDNLTMTLNVE